MSSSPVLTLARVERHPLASRDVVSSAWSMSKTVREMYALRTSYEEAVRAFRERFVVNVLMAHSCHLGKTAEALGMHRNTLTRTIRDLDIDLRQIRNSRRR
jgi:Fis family transcriptional regulator